MLEIRLPYVIIESSYGSVMTLKSLFLCALRIFGAFSGVSMQLDGLFFFIVAIVIGYFAAKLRFIPNEAENVLPPLLMNVCYPGMILSAFSQIDLDTLLTTGLVVCLATLIITLALHFLSGLILRNAPQNRRSLLRFQCGIGNVTYVAIPLLSVFLGPSAIFVAVMHGVAQDLLIWSLYYPMFLGSSGGALKSTVKKLFTSPCFIALLIGLALKGWGLGIPSLFMTAIDGFAGMASPLALLYLGALACKYGVFRWVCDRAAILYSVYKAVILPLCVTLILLPFCERQTAILLGILFGSPAPIMSIVWSGSFEGDVPFAIDCCICSTLLYLALISAACFALTSFGILVYQ